MLKTLFFPPLNSFDIFLKTRNSLINTENKLVVAGGRERGKGKVGGRDQEAPTSSYKINKSLGHLGGPLVKHPTLEFISGHDPRVVGSSPMLGSTLSLEPA